MRRLPQGAVRAPGAPLPAGPGGGSTELVSLGNDRDVLSRLRAGRGSQIRANDILRQAVTAPTRTTRRTQTKPTSRRSKAQA